jgi:hypothetical protein
MELVLALIIFIGMITSWLMLPGSTTNTVATTPEVSERSGSALSQPA